MEEEFDKISKKIEAMSENIERMTSRMRYSYARRWSRYCEEDKESDTKEDRDHYYLT